MFGVALNVLGAFTGLSVHGAVSVRYFQLEKKELAEYAGTCVWILATSTTVMLLIVTAFGPWLATVSGVPKDWLLLATVISGLQFLANIQLSIWLAARQAIKYGAFQISQSLSNAGFSLILVLMVGLAWQGRVLGQALAIGIFGIVALWWLLKDNWLKRPATWRTQGLDALKFGVPLIPHVIGGLIISTAGQLLVTNMFGIYEAGIYVVGLQIGSAMGLVSDAFSKSYSPWLYEKLKEGSLASRHFIVGITYCAFLSFLFLSAAASLAIFIIFPLIVGEGFLPARLLTAYFIFGSGFVGMYYAVAGLFFFSSKTPLISIVSIFSGVISVVAMWALGQVLGLTGIALGYFLSQVIMFLLAWAISTVVCPMPWFQIRSVLAAISAGVK